MYVQVYMLLLVVHTQARPNNVKHPSNIGQFSQLFIGGIFLFSIIIILCKLTKMENMMAGMVSASVKKFHTPHTIAVMMDKMRKL